MVEVMHDPGAEELPESHRSEVELHGWQATLWSTPPECQPRPPLRHGNDYGKDVRRGRHEQHAREQVGGVNYVLVRTALNTATARCISSRDPTEIRAWVGRPGKGRPTMTLLFLQAA